MRSNFDSPLKVVDGVVEACGELDWGSGETEAVVTITISQKDEKIVGTATSPPSFDAPEDEWMLMVKPAQENRKFKKGSAHATGVIHALGDGIEPKVFNWSQDIELEG
jgi:hypothetical protein